MNFEGNRRRLLKGVITVAALPALSAWANIAGKKGATTTIQVALLDIRNASENAKYRNEIEQEARKALPPDHLLNLIDIPRDVHKDREKLRVALHGRPFFACVTITPTTTIWAAEILKDRPIIFSLVSDPKRNGVMRQGGSTLKNVTGFTSFSSLHIKRWEILTQAYPDIDEVVVLAGSGLDELVADAEKVGKLMGKKIRVVTIDMTKPSAPQMRMALARKRIAIDVPHTALMSVNPYAIIDCINEARLPSIYDGTHAVKWGGLLSYEADPLPDAQTIVEYLLLLLQGVAPQNISVRYPSRFTLAVNLETASMTNIEINKSLLVRANIIVKKTTRSMILS